MENVVTLTQRDQLRLRVLQEWDRGSYGTQQAVELLDCSLRQARRLLASYRRSGIASLPHGNRGRPPAHKLDPQIVARATDLLTGEYVEFNNHHAQEMLAERHGLALSVSSVRRLRAAAGKSSPRKRRAPKHRSRRERKAQAGMMLQIDGSPHRWFGPQGEEFCLLVAVDDANGEVFARFEEHENCLGYMRLLKSIITRRGIPLSLYADQHTIFRSPKAKRLSIDEQLAGAEPQTQFSRACREMGITIITAHSPQAKGRVENQNRTLQDRLIAELRQQQITDREQAQRFLKDFLRRYNRRFNTPAADPQPAYRPISEATSSIANALCLKFDRRVDNDNTCSFGNRRLQLPKHQQSHAKSRIEIRVDLQGRISFWKHGQLIGRGPQLKAAQLATVQGLASLLPPTPAKLKPTKTRPAAKIPPVPPPKPAADHPWRTFTYGKNDPANL